jgi:hypothetical protein
MMGNQRVSPAQGQWLASRAAATRHIEAMAMHAGKSVASVEAVVPVAEVIRSWSAAAEACR